MRRRAFLALTTSVAGGFAGCGAGEDGTVRPTDTAATTGTGTTSTETTRTPTRRPLPALDVEYWDPWGVSYRVQTTPAGAADHAFECGTLDTRTETTDLTAAERTRLRSILADADPGAWREFYSCTDACATDQPEWRVTVARGDSRFESGFNRYSVDVPDSLVALTGFVREALLPAFDRPDSCRVRALPPRSTVSG